MKKLILSLCLLLALVGPTLAAGEIKAVYTSGLTLYAVEYNPTGTQVLTPATPAFGTFSSASWASYAIPLTETAAGSGLYVASEPAGTPAGRLPLLIYVQQGASPAYTDIAAGGGQPAVTGTLEWTSTASVGVLDAYTQAAAGTTLVTLALPNAAPASAGGLITRGTGAGQINPSGTGAVPASTLNGLTPPVNWNLASIDTSGRALLQPSQPGVTIPTVTTVGTLTTYTGNTPQSGDAYARLGTPAGASVSFDIASANAQLAAVSNTVSTLPTAAQNVAAYFAYSLHGMTFADWITNTGAVTFGTPTITQSGNNQTSAFAVNGTTFVTSVLGRSGTTGLPVTKSVTLSNQ